MCYTERAVGNNSFGHLEYNSGDRQSFCDKIALESQLAATKESMSIFIVAIS